ncbi:MAG TPA: hypothetical protein ENO05_09350 [Bacteroides sp.]|nr:hypothetical protein [Bacteroides sp.]
MFLLLFLLCSGSEKGAREIRGTGPGTIRFSGFDWSAVTSGPRSIPPGPNQFSGSRENVWVDKQGRLHLKITCSDGQWKCAGVILRGAVAHGRYCFKVSTNLDELNEYVVAGMFLYRDDHNEADIEFSRWGNPLAEAGQYALQPYDRDGNVHRFSMEDAGERSTHIIDWKPESVSFLSHSGHGEFYGRIGFAGRTGSAPGSSQQLISSWTYRGQDIPAGNRVRLMINLWLYRGTPPPDLKEAELIIESVSVMSN